MPAAETAVAVFGDHMTAEDAVRKLTLAGFDIKALTIVGKGFHTEATGAGFASSGDHFRFWGARGAFWGGLWGILLSGVFLTLPPMGPVVVVGHLTSTLIAVVEGTEIVDGLSAIGGALASIGVPHDSAIEYEAVIKADGVLVMAHGSADEVARGKGHHGEPRRVEGGYPLGAAKGVSGPLARWHGCMMEGAGSMKPAAGKAPEQIKAPPAPVAAQPAIAVTGPKEGATSRRWHWTWLWLAPLIAGVGALVWFFGVPLAFGPIITSAPLVRSDLVQTLVASGHIETPFRVSISSQITGVIAAIPVMEGQQVGAGDVLMRLDDSEAKASVVLAEGQLAQADARVRQVRDLTLPSAEQTLIEARATLVNTQQIYERASKLLAGGIATRVAFDDATKNLDVARGQVRAAELIVFTNSPGGADFTVAETQAAQARATLRAAGLRLGYATIKAARDGVLIWRDVEVGNVVQPGKELMRLSPVGDVQISIQIDEKNLGLVALRQQALASADAFANDRFPATVIFINPGVDLQRASVEVKLNVTKPPSYLRQDMTVSVDIEVARRPGVLVVPVADLHDFGTASPWLLALDDGRARRRPVTVGLVSAGKAEIITGLAEGDVVLPAAAKISEGARIRVRAPATPRP